MGGGRPPGQGVPLSPNSPRMVKARSIEMRACQLRISGMSCQEISDELEEEGIIISAEGVRDAIKRSLAKFKQETQETVDEVLQLELQRLDKLLLPAMSAAESGDFKAMDRVLDIMRLRGQYLGLTRNDPPVKEVPQVVEIAVNWQMIPKPASSPALTDSSNHEPS